MSWYTWHCDDCGHMAPSIAFLSTGPDPICPECDSANLIGPDGAPLPSHQTMHAPPVWRTGRKLGRTLYRDEVCVGMVDTPELAAEVVAALNASRGGK